jgi:hypothetical protein
LDPNPSGNGARHFALDGQDAAQLTLIALCPEVSLITDLDKLCADADPAASATHAAFYSVFNPQFPANLVNAFLGLLVLHHGGASNNAQPRRMQASKLSDQFFRHAIDEVLLPRVAAQILQRQHGKSDSFRPHLGLSYAFSARPCQSCDEAVTVPRQGFDEAWILRRIA